MSTVTQTCPRCAEPQERHRPSDGCPYNGWRNYETWVTKLWMDNDEGSQRNWARQARWAWNEATQGEFEWQTREQQATYALSKSLRAEHEELASETLGDAGVLSDLLSAALQEVFWEEIAQSLIDEVDKTEEPSEEGDDEDESANQG